MVCKKKIKRFINILNEKQIKLCLAESITGGNFAFEIIKNAGASKIIDFSVVCYSDSSKRKILKIDNEISKFGVVSKQVAESMAKNVIKFSNDKSALALSCTGQAGPEKINENENVGLVYIGANFNKIKYSFKKEIIQQNRILIINQTINEMIDIGMKIIRK